jgi:hypothetical protein
MSRLKVKIRRQRPVEGGRETLPSCVIKAIKERVDEDATANGVSKSFVVAVGLAWFYGIKEQETFYPSKSGVSFVKRPPRPRRRTTPQPTSGDWETP